MPQVRPQPWGLTIPCRVLQAAAQGCPRPYSNGDKCYCLGCEGVRRVWRHLHAILAAFDVHLFGGPVTWYYSLNGSTKPLSGRPSFGEKLALLRLAHAALLQCNLQVIMPRFRRLLLRCCRCDIALLILRGPQPPAAWLSRLIQLGQAGPARPLAASQSSLQVAVQGPTEQADLAAVDSMLDGLHPWSSMQWWDWDRDRESDTDSDSDGDHSMYWGRDSDGELEPEVEPDLPSPPGRMHLRLQKPKPPRRRGMPSQPARGASRQLQCLCDVTLH